MVPLAGTVAEAPGPLVSGGKIYAATMDHLLVRPIGGEAWQAMPSATPGRDVTAVQFVTTELWTASRRGIGIAAR